MPAIQRQLDAFHHDAENIPQWMREHKAVEALAELEDFIAIGCKLFDAIAEIRRKRVPDPAAAPELDREFVCHFNHWIMPCPEVLRATEHFENLGYAVDRADELRDRYAKAVGVLAAASRPAEGSYGVTQDLLAKLADRTPSTPQRPFPGDDDL